MRSRFESIRFKSWFNLAQLWIRLVYLLAENVRDKGWFGMIHLNFGRCTWKDSWNIVRLYLQCRQQALRYNPSADTPEHEIQTFGILLSQLKTSLSQAEAAAGGLNPKGLQCCASRHLLQGKTGKMTFKTSTNYQQKKMVGQKGKKKRHCWLYSLNLRQKSLSIHSSDVESLVHQPLHHCRVSMHFPAIENVEDLGKYHHGFRTSQWTCAYLPVNIYSTVDAFAIKYHTKTDHVSHRNTSTNETPSDTLCHQRLTHFVCF